ncbi:MAG: S41 family peptidase, partial [Bdellovibrionota bacterium]
VTNPLLSDTRPFFDPSGEYLYFLSYREFDPVYDNMHFDLSFPRGVKPYLVTLKKDVLPPWHPEYPGRANGGAKDDGKSGEKSGTKSGEKSSEKKDGKSGKKDAPVKIEIDFDGIQNRIAAFPLPDGRYLQIAATKEKLFFTRQPIRGTLNADNWTSTEPTSDISLETFDLETEKTETLVNNIASFRLSKDGKFLMYRNGNSLRVLKAGEKPPSTSDDYKRGGWIDLNRVQIPVTPRTEWKQMYREAWRLQRDQFWTEDMSKIDWARVYSHYLPLIDRIGTRSEISDVIWEMQGELGTSHAYEIGGDYRWDPHYGVGLLGMDCTWDSKANAYRLTKVLLGDPWDESCSSPLSRAGVGLKAGDFLVAIDGVRLTRETQPCKVLLHKAGRDVAVTFRRSDAKTESTRSVRTLRSEQKLRYREWVEGNRRWVHEKSGGKIGYVHVPNMGPFGYSEFHRGFLPEIDRDGLIIDVRFNGGGHVSQLLLEKLARRRIGYTKSRWTGVYPFPNEAPSGPMVALTNEHAGSDGDIFSHSFKMMKLGPLLGKRTWGGVIGISPSHSLVDGGITTQPEYSFWFSDVGWKVENYGTDPDIEVEFPPDAYAKGRDPQLEAALKACQHEMEQKPILRPSALGDLPDLRLPWRGERV